MWLSMSVAWGLSEHRKSSSITHSAGQSPGRTNLAAYLHVAAHLDAHRGSGQANEMF